MNGILNIVENGSTSEFYPTPKALIDKMLTGIDFRTSMTILEPSAGKGDIVKAMSEKINIYDNRNIDIDVIEIDTHLQQILKYNFSLDRRSDLKRQASDLKNKYFTYNRKPNTANVKDRFYKKFMP